MMVRRSRFAQPTLALLLAGSASVGCAPPDNALVHGCMLKALELSSRCYVRAKRLDKDQFATFDADTKNELVRVNITVRVQRGDVTIELPGCVQGKGVVRPSAPLVLQCDSKLNRNNYTLSLWARPTSGPVEGLEGEVIFRPL